MPAAPAASPVGPLRTPLTDLLGIKHPVLLAPMGDTAGGRLAAAVSNAGGLGMVGGGYARLDWLERELEAAGDARVGVGFITFALDERPAALHRALAARPVAIQLSFGDPRPYADDVHAAGSLLICQVQSDDEVRQALDAGADVLIAQGHDGGGHGRPGRGTIGLVPSLVDRVGEVPVAAAGGIADGRGLAAALVLGAGGVSLGTRFLASAEAISTPAEAAALVAASGADTIRTPVIDAVRGPAWPAAYDGRVVRNAFVDEWHGRPDEVAARRDELAAVYHGSASDDYTVRALWAGEGIDAVTSIPPAGELVEQLVTDAAARLRAWTP